MCDIWYACAFACANCIFTQNMNIYEYIVCTRNRCSLCQRCWRHLGFPSSVSPTYLWEKDAIETNETWKNHGQGGLKTVCFNGMNGLEAFPSFVPPWYFWQLVDKRTKSITKLILIEPWAGGVWKQCMLMVWTASPWYFWQLIDKNTKMTKLISFEPWAERFQNNVFQWYELTGGFSIFCISIGISGIHIHKEPK